jgi:hypothetical protein
MRWPFIERKALHHLLDQGPDIEAAGMSPKAVKPSNPSTGLNPMFHWEYVAVLHNGTQPTLTRSYRDQFSRIGFSCHLPLPFIPFHH